MLCTPADLGHILGLGEDLDEDRAAVIIQAATAVVQEACDSPPQRLVLVEDDPFDLLGSIGPWLALPQRPVREVPSVILDGQTLTDGADYKRFGARLWRATGWQQTRYEPSRITGVYSHGYAPKDQGLQLARSAVLSLVRGVYDNPSGAISVRIDDYSESYGKFAVAMEAEGNLRNALERQYGRRVSLARVGGA